MMNVGNKDANNGDNDDVRADKDNAIDG